MQTVPFYILIKAPLYLMISEVFYNETIKFKKIIKCCLKELI